ncbi:MAG: hypothetical protein WC848_02275 [Parcubacteria group bacterium]|jgi:hypothetical protein
MDKKEICVLPGTGQIVKNYGYDGLDIWITGQIEVIPDAKVFIGHSLGASFILKSKVNSASKFIFINPLVKKRNFFMHFINWIRFLVFEGFKVKKAVPAKYWGHTFRQVVVLLRVDVLKQLKQIPKENIIIIRGKFDNYFCDRENFEILKANNFSLLEVDAGHDWNANVAKAVASIIESWK